MFKFNWYNKFGTIPSSYREAMSYEEQILWLCKQIEDLKIESGGNYNYNLLENKPTINGVTLVGNLTSEQLGLDYNYNFALNKPSINGVTLVGNKSLTDLGIQGKLTAGSGIRIIGNTISATGGGSGGTSDYESLENKPAINGNVLIGDLTARELKLQNLLEVNRTSELDENDGKVADLGNYQLYDILPQNIPETNQNRGSYVVYKVAKGSYFDINGNYDLYYFDEQNSLQEIYTTNNEVDYGYFDSPSNGTLIINFFNLGTYNAELKEFYSGESLNKDINNLNKKINFTNYDLNIILLNYFEYVSLLGNAQNGIFVNLHKGETLPFPTSVSDSKYVKIPKYIDYSCIFIASGSCIGANMWFTTKVENGVEYVSSLSELNLETDGLVYVDIPDDADYIYFQFSNFGLFNNLQAMKIKDIEGASVNKLSSTLVLLADTTPSLESGLYALDSGIFIGSASPNNLVYSTGELIYYDSTSKIFYGTLKSVALENGTWTIYQNENIENELSDSRNKIPTSHAVYEAVQNAGSFYTPLQNDITFNLDGTISDSTGTLTLTDGFYLTKLVNYVDDEGTNLAPALSQNYCYYNSSSNRLTLSGLQRGGLLSYNTFLSYLDSTNGWFYWNKSFADVLDTSKIETTISSSSTNSKVAGAKAVYDIAMANGIPEIPATTTTIDLTTLEPGLYHFNHTATINCGNNVSFQASTGRDNFLSLKPLSQTTKIFTIFNGVQTYYGSVGASSSRYFEAGFSTCEQLANKVSAINSSYTQDTQYPSAKAVYNALNTNVFRKSADPVQVTTSEVNNSYIVPLTIGQYSSPYFTANQDGTISVNSSVIKGVKVQATINVQETDSTDRELCGRIEIVYNGVVVNYAESWNYTKGGRVTFNLINTYQANEGYIIRLVIRQSANTSINHNVVAYCSVEGLV